MCAHSIILELLESRGLLNLQEAPSASAEFLVVSILLISIAGLILTVLAFVVHPPTDMVILILLLYFFFVSLRCRTQPRSAKIR